jgi:hypothetical protein
MSAFSAFCARLEGIFTWRPARVSSKWRSRENHRPIVNYDITGAIQVSDGGMD